MNILILGGTLFIGRHLVDLLVSRGHHVTILNRGVTPVQLPAAVTRLTADREQPDTVAAALKGKRYDAVIDIFAQTPDHIQPVLDALGDGIGHYVFCSTVATYADSDIAPVDENCRLAHDAAPDSYSKVKIASEELLTKVSASGQCPTTSIRAPVVYGPHNPMPEREASYFHRIRLGRPVVVAWQGNALLHQIHVDDLVDGFATVLNDPRAFGEIFNVCGPYATTHTGYVATIAEALDLPVRIIPVEDPKQLEKITTLAPGIFPFGQVDVMVYNTEKFRHTFDWSPRFSLRDGMAMTHQWWLDQGYDKTDWDFSGEDKALQHLGIEW